MRGLAGEPGWRVEIRVELGRGVQFLKSYIREMLRWRVWREELWCWARRQASRETARRYGGDGGKKHEAGNKLYREKRAGPRLVTVSTASEGSLRNQKVVRWGRKRGEASAGPEGDLGSGLICC